MAASAEMQYEQEEERSIEDGSKEEEAEQSTHLRRARAAGCRAGATTMRRDAPLFVSFSPLLSAPDLGRYMRSGPPVGGYVRVTSKVERLLPSGSTPRLPKFVFIGVVVPPVSVSNSRYQCVQRR